MCVSVDFTDWRISIKINYLILFGTSVQRQAGLKRDKFSETLIELLWATVSIIIDLFSWAFVKRSHESMQTAFVVPILEEYDEDIRIYVIKLVIFLLLERIYFYRIVEFYRRQTNRGDVRIESVLWWLYRDKLEGERKT